jgi:flavin-dependent dehydrogenase
LSVEDFDALETAGPGWLLAGDAAGLVDPVTREGIYFALKSAEHAADALTDVAGSPDRQYHARIRDDIAPELIRAARLKAGFFRPRFARLVIHALQQSEGIRRVMADLIAGTQSYRGLEWRLAKTLEVGLAWELLRLRNFDL